MNYFHNNTIIINYIKMDYKKIGTIIGVIGGIFYTNILIRNYKKYRKIQENHTQNLIQAYDYKLHYLETYPEVQLINNPKIINLTGKNIQLYTKNKLICKLLISDNKLLVNQKIEKTEHEITFDLYSNSKSESESKSESKVGKIPIKTKSNSTILYGFSDDLLNANVLVTKDVADFLFSDEGIERYQGKLNEVFILDDSTLEYDEMGIFLGYTHLIYYGSLQQM